MRRLGLADILAAGEGGEIDVRAAVANRQGERRKRSLLERHVAGTTASRHRDRRSTLDHGPDNPAILFESRRLGIDAIPAILLADLYSYWLTRCGPRSLPSYEDLDTIRIAWALGRISLIKVEQNPMSFEPSFQVLVDASRQAQARGLDLTGACISDIRPAGFARLLEAHYEEAAVHSAPSLRAFKVSRDVTEITCTSLALPLSHGGTEVDMLLTCLVGAEALWQMFRSDPTPSAP